MQLEWMNGWNPWLTAAAVTIAVVVAALLVHRLAFAVATRVVGRTGAVIDDALVRHGRRPSIYVLVVVALLALRPLLPLSDEIATSVQRVLSVVLIGAVAWLVIALSRTAEDYVAFAYDLTKPDNLMARQVHTQTRMLRRIAVVVVVIVAVCAMLMTIPEARQLGLSLFASAGIAGLVIGMAARPALSNLIAGVQLALTQPIRVDDVVIVEGEWGRIEEINTTFVVVRIWDLRRLVVPLTYFIERPFQNWTRTTAAILGTVFVYVDYAVPVEAVRSELRRIVEASELWDSEVCGLQVTGTTDKTMELRALVSAADSGRAWELRCLVRERLLAFLQESYPQSLPQLRLTQTSPTADAPAAA